MKMLKMFRKKPVVNPHKNQPCYDEYGRFLGWYSRSVACVMFVFCKDSSGEWCVLSCERGAGAADNNFLWNVPCGYLDFNETTYDCAVRECLEETGILVNRRYLSFVGFQDEPTENRQNVSFRYAAIIDDKTTDDFKFSKILNETDEVGRIKWIKMSDIHKYVWAFEHDNRIMEVFNFNLAAAKL